MAGNIFPRGWGSGVGWWTVKTDESRRTTGVWRAEKSGVGREDASGGTGGSEGKIGKIGKIGQVPWIHPAGLGTVDRPSRPLCPPPQWLLSGVKVVPCLGKGTHGPGSGEEGVFWVAPTSAPPNSHTQLCASERAAST